MRKFVLFLYYAYIYHFRLTFLAFDWQPALKLTCNERTKLLFFFSFDVSGFLSSSRVNYKKISSPLVSYWTHDAGVCSNTHGCVSSRNLVDMLFKEFINFQD